jgi:hypothetical protein
MAFVNLTSEQIEEGAILALRAQTWGVRRRSQGK